MTYSASPHTWSGHWIGGTYHQGSRTGAASQSVSPNSGQRLLEFWSFDKDLGVQAIAAAAALEVPCSQWKERERLDALAQLRQTLADYADVFVSSLCREAGKPAHEARQEIAMASRHLDELIQWGPGVFEQLLAPARLDKRGVFRLRPIGIAVAYVPFSTPLLSTIMYSAAAILAGTPLVLTAAPQASLTLSAFAEMLHQKKIAPLAVSVLFGNFTEFRNLLNDKRIAAVLYAGSREHCDEIRTSSRAFLGRQLVLQSGGKNAVFVDESADLVKATDAIITGLTRSAGQLCSSTSRVFVHQGVARKLEELIAERLAKLSIHRTDESLSSSEQYMGPLYSTKAVEKFLRFQTMASREQGRTVMWGKQLTQFSGGSFVTPGFHVLKTFDINSAYQTNVMLGPDLAMYECSSMQEAVDSIHKAESSYVVACFGSKEVLDTCSSLLNVPNIVLNGPTVEESSPWPFAGRLQSGHSRFHGLGLALYLSAPQGIF